MLGRDSWRPEPYQTSQVAEHDLYHLLENYLKRNPKAVVVMITHDLSVARFHSDKVLVLNRRLYNCGTPEEVMTEDCLKEAFGHQGHGHSLKLAHCSSTQTIFFR